MYVYILSDKIFTCAPLKCATCSTRWHIYSLPNGLYTVTIHMYTYSYVYIPLIISVPVPLSSARHAPADEISTLFSTNYIKGLYTYIHMLHKIFTPSSINFVKWLYICIHTHKYTYPWQYLYLCPFSARDLLQHMKTLLPPQLTI